MKLTAKLIKAFEADQAEFGTRVALHNFLWHHIAAAFHGIGHPNVQIVAGKAETKG